MWRVQTTIDLSTGGWSVYTVNAGAFYVEYWGRFGKRTILYGCVIAVGCTPTLYGLWQTFREMR